MNMMKGFSIATLLMGLVLNTASANYTVTQVDCENEDYTKQVELYSQKISAAEKMNDHDLVSQLREAHKMAEDNARACALMKKQ